MYFTETEIQTQNWRDLATGPIVLQYTEEDVVGFQYVPRQRTSDEAGET